jgi:single-strand DNA-binding protein
MNYNKVILGGNMTRDVEMRYTPKGTAVAAFGLAINRKWRTDAGEDREEVTFVDVEAFGRTAEVIGQYFRKGNPIMVEGRLKLDQWEDKQSGSKRSKLKVIVDSFQFCGEATGEKGESRRQPERSRRTAQADDPGTPATSEAPPVDDDVPF